MKNISLLKHRRLAVVALCAAVGILSHSASAQTATWTGFGGANFWNNDLNWDIGVPAEGTNAVLLPGSFVTYAVPMSATSFAGLDNAGALEVDGPGFNIDAAGLAAYAGQNGSLLRINPGGVFVAVNSGNVTLATGSEIAVDGGVLVITNSPGNIVAGVNGNNAGFGFTNNGGTVVFGMPFQSRGRFSRFEMHGGSLEFQAGGGIFEGSNDQERRFLINGGIANLGDFTIARTQNGVSQAGLVISNGVVNVTSLRVGTANAAAGTTVAGGVLTNTGAFTISDRTNGATGGNRRIHFYIRGGSVYSSGSEGIIVANQSNTDPAAATIIGANLDVNSGQLVAEGITLVRDASLLNAHATLTLAGTGEVYLGTVGLVGNAGVSGTSYTMNLNGGTLGAKDHFTIVGNGTLSGTFTVKAADLSGAPRNITLNGAWSGAGALVKTGGGVLTLEQPSTYSGTTLIEAGTLALGAGGGIPNSPTLTVAAGATLDVSANLGYTLGSSRTLAGLGSVAGDFSAAAGATINPGSNTMYGTLTFSNSVAQSGDTINHFDLSANPAGSDNDLMIVTGDLNLSGVNIIEVAGGGAAGSIHPLIKYGGNFNGTLANFNLSGASGSLSNNATTKTIYLVIEATVRRPTDIVWVGNPALNDWDLLNVTNWSNTGVLDYFVTGDRVLFNGTGAANPIVNLVGNVAPTSVTVDAAADYTFMGSGHISGPGGLLKTNTGTLTIMGEHTYNGPTVVEGGVLAAATLANGGFPSSIGGSPAGAENLVINGGTLRYTGDTVASDRGATLNTNGGTVDIATDATELTLSGNVGGDGSLTKTGAGTLALAGANSYTNGTVINDGVLRLNAGGAAGNGGVTNNGATLRIGVNGTVTVPNAMNVAGEVTVDLNNAAGDAHFTGAWSGDGTVNVINQQNATRTFTVGGNGSGGGHLHEFSGTISMGSNPGTLRFNDGGGNPNVGGTNVTIDLGDGAATFLVRNGGVTIDVGELRGGVGTMVRGRASGSSGTVTYSIGGKNLDSVFNGSILDSTSGNPTALIKVGAGKLTLTGPGDHTGTTTVNEGDLQIDGVFSASFVSVFGGRLSGSGSLPSVEVQFSATLSPGVTIGQMTIGALVLYSGGTNFMEVNKTAGTADSIVGLSSLSIGGTLVITNEAGAFAAGDSFKLFDFVPGTAFGAFEVIEPESPGAGLRWDQSTLAEDGMLRVATEGLGIATFSFDGTTVNTSGSGGTPFVEYQVLSSTNVAAPINEWETNAINFFDGAGNFNFSTVVETDEPRRFFLLQFQSP